METIQGIKADLEEARAGYQAIAQTATATELATRTADIKRLMADLSAAIAEGAQDCPECGTPPHGMEQPRAVGRRTYTFYEVGCLTCPLRSLEMTREQAVESWNNGQYLEPLEA